MLITSKDNETIKAIKKLKEKKYRDEAKQYIAEGIKLIKEAIEEKCKIATIVVCEDCVKDGSIDQKLLYEIAKYQCLYVTEKIFSQISEVKNPQGILAVIEKEEEKKRIKYTEDVIVVLDGIQDPGNLGTILRTVDSVGLSQIIKSQDTGDVYNSKVVRSTMGAIFRVNVIESPKLETTMQELKKHGYQIVATDLATEHSVYDISYKKVAIVIGNEANGVRKEILEIADKKIKIPMLGKTESLNASVATGVILYEYVRQSR